MRGITGWLAVVVVLLLHGGGAGVAADPWQLDGWKARAVVTIAKPLPDASQTPPYNGNSRKLIRD